MIGSFTFDGIDSESFNLVCKSVKRPLLPAAKVRRVEPAGLSGVYDFDENVEYESRSVTMKLQYIGSSFEELRSRARQIAAWLSARTWARLTINDEPDKYYLAKVTDEIDLESQLEFGEADISFDCQPFAYSVNQQSFTFFGTGSFTNHDFVNPGTRVINFRSPPGSKFTIQIAGTWTSFLLALNTETLAYNDPGSGILTIDNIDMTATLSTVNVFDKLSGDIDTFLQIIPGNNVSSVSGVDLNLTITVTYIPLWM